jgi:threonine aldolase
MVEARRIRKMLGGGMRQAGVLAAAGLVALDEMLPRLIDDHATARHLAEQLAELPGIDLDPRLVETNIVTFKLTADTGLSAQDLATKLGSHGVLVHALGAHSIRMVTHYEISMADVETAARIARQVLIN